MQLITLVIILALIFDFINGFHDAANSIATVVSTKVLSPLTAVIWAAAFNFLAYWIFELKVADTVAKTVNKENATLLVVLSGVIGSFAGAGIANAGSFSAVQYDKVMPTVYFIVLAPLIGLFMAYLISILTINICRRFNPSKVDIVFRRLQLLSSAAYSLGHGGNDAQKVMGIIAAAMVSQGIIGDIKELPEWVPLACYTAIAAGTLIGGWKIVKTMGQKITKLSPFEGFSAETAGALTLFGRQHFKIPVSTTHTITGAIIGVGVTKRVSAVRWGVTIQLIWAWILTIPVSGLLAAGIFYLIRMFMN